MTIIQKIGRFFKKRQQLWLSAVVGIVVLGVLPDTTANHPGTRFLLAWNISALTYLLLVVRMVRMSGPELIQKRAMQFLGSQHKSSLFVTTMVLTSAIAVFIAIGSQLVLVKDMTGLNKVGHIALTGMTVLTSWLFTNSLFALHYAHDFYLTRELKQLDIMQFPGTPDPDYWDFLYCALVIGASGQTSDVTFAHQRIRRVALLHCSFSFFFNTIVLAMTINIAAGLL
jgi:uncharacterized membrane protein